LGALIVSVASLAWTIYTDRKKAAATPSAEVLARQLRVEIGEPEGATIEQRDRIIGITVTEVLDQGG
jgi:hypothetical protein